MSVLSLGMKYCKNMAALGRADVKIMEAWNFPIWVHKYNLISLWNLHALFTLFCYLPLPVSSEYTFLRPLMGI